MTDKATLSDIIGAMSSEDTNDYTFKGEISYADGTVTAKYGQEYYDAFSEFIADPSGYDMDNSKLVDIRDDFSRYIGGIYRASVRLDNPLTSLTATILNDAVEGTFAWNADYNLQGSNYYNGTVNIQTAFSSYFIALGSGAQRSGSAVITFYDEESNEYPLTYTLNITADGEEPVVEYDIDYVNDLIAQGQDVVIEKDLTGGLIVPEGVDVSIDLGGYTITSSDCATLSVYGTCTVDNGTLACTGYYPAVFVSTSGECTIEGGSYTASSWYAVQVQGECIVNGGTIECTINNTSAVECGFDMDKASDAEAFYAVGDPDYVAKMEFHDGTVVGAYHGIKCDEHGQIYVFDGEVTASAQAVLNWNQTALAGGSFTSTGSATVVSNGVYNGSAGQVVITGGTFTGASEGEIVAGISGYSEGISYTIYAGTYSPSAPSEEYLADGVTLVQDSEGNFIAISDKWTYVEGGPQGGGFMSLKRLMLYKSEMNYVEGGIEIPRFNVTAPIFVSAKGGVIPYYDTENGRIVLYKPDGTEAIGLLEDVFIVVVGTN